MQTPLDELSNSVLDAIEARRYDEAEKLCRRLLSEYPDLMDGHERLAELRKQQGRFQEAVDHYNQALQIIEQNSEGFGEEALEYLKELRDEALAKIPSKH